MEDKKKPKMTRADYLAFEDMAFGLLYYSQARKQPDCPNCGGKLVRTAGCQRCADCGYKDCE